MRKLLSLIILILSFISFTSAKEKQKEIIFPTDNKFIYDACLSKNGKVIICTDNKSLKAFSISNKELIGNFMGGHRDKILCVAISPDSTMIASGGGDSTLVIWDLNSRTIMQRITFAAGKITSIKFSPNNQYILFGCSNSPAYLYDIKEQKTVFEFSDQKLDVTSVAFSTTGSLIAIAGGDKTIRLYNTSNFQLISELKGHTDWIRSISFYNQDKNLISCGDNKYIYQWNISRANYKILNSHKSWILSLDVDNSGINQPKIYAFGTMNGSIIIDYGFGSYKDRISYPITKVLILPNESGLIEIAVATLGSGLMYFSATNMKMTN